MSYGDRSRSPRREREKISVLVRNLPLDTRPDEIRDMFERFGRIRDVYLPKDYYSRRPKGFGFVEFVDERDAQDAIYELDGKRFGGRQIQVCRSRETRKNPEEMRSRDRRGGGGGRRRSRSRDGYRRRRSPSRSRSPRRDDDRSRSPRRDDDNDRSRSRSPRRNDDRSPSRSRSPRRSPSRSPRRDDDRSPSPHNNNAPPTNNDDDKNEQD